MGSRTENKHIKIHFRVVVDIFALADKFRGIVHTAGFLIIVMGLIRCRVSQLNYKGGSGRILGSKIEQKQWKSSPKNYFFNENRKCQINQKMDVEKNTKNKIMIKIQKKCFDQNFIKNEFWGPKLQLSEPPRTRKHHNIACQQ